MKININEQFYTVVISFFIFKVYTNNIALEN